MHKPFDTATKHLLEADPLAWLRFVGLPGTSATLRDTNLATLPFAPIAQVTPDELPEVIERMERRIDIEAAPEERASLWTATYLLMGLRYERTLIQRLLRGVRQMKESTTYQAILEEGEARGEAMGEARGRVEEARRILLRLGGRRFGLPDAQTQATIEGLTVLEELERLTDKLLEVESWSELLS